jgi:hypothetical protein
VKVFRELGLLDGLQVHDWDTYQLNRDNSAKRTRRWRARRAGDGDGDASRDGPTGTVHGQGHLESQQSAPEIASHRDESRAIAKDPAAEAAIRDRLGALGVPVDDRDALVARLKDLAAQKGARSLRYVLGRPNAETVSLIEEAVCLWNEQRYAGRKAAQLADRAPLETLERIAPSADVKAQVSRIIGRISEEEAQPA